MTDDLPLPAANVPTSANEEIQGPVEARLKGLVKRLATRLPWPRVAFLETLAGLAALGPWLRRYASGPSLQGRHELYRWLSDQVVGGGPLSFIELGVYRGNSLLAWSTLNKDQASSFHGFDSFEGLPDEWAMGLGTLTRGTFSLRGATPAFDDPRIHLVKGLFADTLPSFVDTFQPCGRLVIHLDADLYGSTLCALTILRPLLLRGTVLVFDEFSSVSHEFRAFRDYCASFAVAFRMLASSGAFYDQVAIEIL